VNSRAGDLPDRRGAGVGSPLPRQRGALNLEVAVVKVARSEDLAPGPAAAAINDQLEDEAHQPSGDHDDPARCGTGKLFWVVAISQRKGRTHMVAPRTAPRRLADSCERPRTPKQSVGLLYALTMVDGDCLTDADISALADDELLRL
jgi:hypothetical protein